MRLGIFEFCVKRQMGRSILALHFTWKNRWDEVFWCDILRGNTDGTKYFGVTFYMGK